MKALFTLLRLTACMVAFIAVQLVVLMVTSWLEGVYKAAIGPESVSHLHEIVSASVIQMFTSILVLVLLVKLVRRYFSARLHLLTLKRMEIEIPYAWIGSVPLIAAPIAAIAIAHFSGRVAEMNDGLRWELLPISMVVVVALAFAEEAMFRGVLLKLLFVFSNAPLWICVIIQAIVFGVLHGKVARESGLNFGSFVVAGVLFALVYTATDRIWMAALCHAWLNWWSGLLGGSSALWFSGALYQDCSESWIVVHRCAILASVLLLIRSIVSSNMKARIPVGVASSASRS